MVWRTSHQYSMLIQEVEEYDNEHPCDSTDDIDLPAVRRPQQVKRLSVCLMFCTNPTNSLLDRRSLHTHSRLPAKLAYVLSVDLKECGAMQALIYLL
jgi:hypothetical protein